MACGVVVELDAGMERLKIVATCSMWDRCSSLIYAHGQVHRKRGRPGGLVQAVPFHTQLSRSDTLQVFAEETSERNEKLWFDSWKSTTALLDALLW